MWNPFKSKKEETALCPVDTSIEENTLTQITPQEPVNYPIGTTPPMTDKNLAIASMANDLAHKALDVYQTSLQVEQNIAAIRAASDVQLAQITSKFEFCKSALDHVFQDRHSALSAHYCILGDAMKTNDREMIIAALHGISSIVVSSPLSDFKEIVNNWSNYSQKNPLKLDF